MEPTTIQDAFAYNPAIRMLPYRFDAACLSQMEVLRRANLYRARLVVLPDDQDILIAAYDTYEYQFEVASGSYLWGLQYQEYDGETYDVTATNNGLIRIVDACTGIPLFSDYPNGSAFSPFSNPANFRGKNLVSLLTHPRLIPTPGQVNVEISNKTTDDFRCQLVLYFAEPCAVVRGEDMRGSIYNATMRMIRGESDPFNHGQR